MRTPLVIAVPKGRILKELIPLLQAVDIQPEPAFFDETSRLLQFSTNHEHVSIIRVRSFDVATYVAFGAAQMGICGSDVLLEFDYSQVYAPLDLNIGHCRLALAYPEDLPPAELEKLSHVRVATKYPHLTHKYFLEQGIQAECVKLNGAMELAPKIGLASHIVDLVSTGSTLRANGLKEVKTLAEISSQLIVNRTAFKTRSQEMQGWMQKFRQAVEGHAHAA
jgi:ATP phosphoribosyltransferase